MMGNKKLSEIKAELAALLGRLPDGSPKKRLNREIGVVKQDTRREEKVLALLLKKLEEEVRKARRPKKRNALRKR